MATTSSKSTTRKKAAKPKTAAAKTSKTSTAKKVTSKKTTKAASKTTAKTASIAPKQAAVKADTKKAVKAPLDKYQKLFRWNVVLAFLHALQAGLVLWLASPDKGVQTITTNYLTTDTLASTPTQPVLVSATRALFDVNLATLIAIFFGLSALAHLSIATWYRKKYEANLQKGINKGRWIEYSLSASTMMVAIALVAGIFDLSTLIMMFALTAVMNLCGLIMEVHNQGKDKVNWLSYIVGCIAGIVPWIVYLIYIVGSNKYGEGGGPPSFVYWILISIFIMFNSFAINMYLQYRKKGKWADYLYGEKVYMILSLVAKSLLAWQVFAGALRP